MAFATNHTAKQTDCDRDCYCARCPSLSGHRHRQSAARSFDCRPGQEAPPPFDGPQPAGGLHRASSPLIKARYGRPVRAAFEATGNDHRALAYHLATAGFEVKRLSSVALARTDQNPVFIIRQDADKQTGDLMLVTDRTASNGNPIVVSIKRQGRDSSGRVAIILVTVYPRDRIKQTVLSAQESNNLRYIRGSRRGLSGYKHTGASYLNASLTDTFNSLRVKDSIRTPRTTFKSGKPPSLFLQKNLVLR